MRLPKILIVCDYPGWVYDFVSNEIILALESRYQFFKIYTCDLPSIDHHNFDVVYCMWWRTDFLERNTIPDNKLCIQVASFWSWQRKFPVTLEELGSNYLVRAKAVTVNCPGLHDLISTVHPNVFLNPGGVDPLKFCEQPPRTSAEYDHLVVGWTGSATTHGDNKGLYDILIPACEGLEGIELATQIREEKWIPHNEMPDFYKDIDVYACVSQSEGTPNPVLEAAASARAVVSTPVGIVPMLIEDGTNGYIVERNIEAVQDAFIQLRDNRVLCAEMGRKNRQRILRDGWSWKERGANYAQMFDFVLDHA